MIESLETEHMNVLKQLRSEPRNACCADCGRASNNWASVNLGVFLCDRCADVHRALGTHISKVKACSGSDLWGPDEIIRMQELDLVFPNKQRYCEAGSANEPSKKDLMELCLKKYGMKTWSCKSSSAPTKRDTCSKNVTHSSDPIDPVGKTSCIEERCPGQADVKPLLQMATDKFDFDAFFGDLDREVALVRRKRPEVKAEQLQSMQRAQPTNEWVLVEEKPPAETHGRFKAFVLTDPSVGAPQALGLKRASTDEVWEGFEDW